MIRQWWLSPGEQARLRVAEVLVAVLAASARKQATA